MPKLALKIKIVGRAKPGTSEEVSVARKRVRRLGPEGLRVRRRVSKNLWTFEDSAGQLYFVVLAGKFEPDRDHYVDESLTVDRDHAIRPPWNTDGW
jgi:hypothetical protein